MIFLEQCRDPYTVVIRELRSPSSVRSGCSPVAGPHREFKALAGAASVPCGRLSPAQERSRFSSAFGRCRRPGETLPWARGKLRVNPGAGDESVLAGETRPAAAPPAGCGHAGLDAVRGAPGLAPPRWVHRHQTIPWSFLETTLNIKLTLSASGLSKEVPSCGYLCSRWGEKNSL